MFVSLDLETTGFDPIKDKIIEFGAVKFDLNKQCEILQFLINPGITIPQIVTHITNISDADLSEASPFEEKIEEIKNFIGDLPIVGHNIQFDTGFLRQNGLEIRNPEYDTQQLSSILVPGLPSYSLEILTKTLDLQHKEKHRALDDAIAAMELFLKLIKEFESLEPELLQKIQALCQKSNWPLKDLIGKITVNGESKHKSKSRKAAKTRGHVDESGQKNNFRQILDANEPSIFEKIPPYNSLVKDLAKNAPQDTCIAVPYQLFRQIEAEIPDTIAKIDSPKNYISLKRLDEFTQKSHFEEYEITSLLKYLIWEEQTNTGLLSEVALFNEEKTTIPKINIDENIENPEEEAFFKKALEKDKNSAAICTHQYIIENLPPNAELIVIDFDKFANSLHRHHSIYLKLDLILEPLNSLKEIEPENQTIESLIAKSTILFGLLGIIFGKTNDENQFAPRSIIDESIISTKEWLDTQKAVQSLIEISQELGEIKAEKTFGYLKQWKKILKDLNQIFRTPEIDKNIIWIEENFRENITIRKVPFSVEGELGELLKSYRNYQIVTEDAEISRPNIELPIRKPVKKSENLDIHIIKDVDDNDKNQIPNFLINYLKNTKEKTAIIFNSRKQLEFFTLKLSQGEVPIISQMTAGIGKLTEQFKNSPESTLLMTPNIWESFEKQAEIDTLFIHKIPFDPPSDPLLLALSQNYKDPFNELQIPRAIFALKKIINKLRGSEKVSKKAVILDSRLVTKGYGLNFVKKLREIATVSETTLENFHH